MPRHMVIRKTKGTQPPVPKTTRCEMDPLHRAIAVQMEADGHTCKSIGDRFGRNTSTISEMIKRIKKRAEEEGRSMNDPELYKTNGRRGRLQKLSPHWKQVLVETVMASLENRKARPEQLMKILPPDFPEVSTSCLESALYENHFRRVNHLWKSTQEDRLKSDISSNLDPNLSSVAIDSTAPQNTTIPPPVQFPDYLPVTQPSQNYSQQPYPMPEQYPAVSQDARQHPTSKPAAPPQQQQQ